MKKDIELPQLDDYRSLFLNNTPLLDVRAPIEFSQGAFPLTENFPLMNDQEREEIGIRYKDSGQDEAIKLGHELVQGKIKDQRVSDWSNFIERHPEGILYCFRGGMRSKISQQWLYEKTGVMYPRVKGGYKAMRRFLIDELEVSIQRIAPIILSGRTGIGKTILLKDMNQQIDLEGVFHHRGSVFGNHVTPQPSQIDIENSLSIQLIKLLHQGHNKIILEDESANIGPRSIPKSLVKKMKESPIVVLNASLVERIDITYQEYIVESLSEYQSFYDQEKGFNLWAEQLINSIDKIKKRLGGLRHKDLKNLLENAIQRHLSDSPEYHKEWIKVLLSEYYDPMYDYQLSKKQDRVIFTGNRKQISNFLETEHKIN